MRGSAWAWVQFLLKSGVGVSVSQAHSLLVNLKSKSRNLKYKKQEKKNNKPNSPNGQLLKSSKMSKIKKPQWREAALLFI